MNELRRLYKRAGKKVPWVWIVMLYSSMIKLMRVEIEMT